MNTKRITIVLEFTEEYDADEDWTERKLSKIKLDKGRTTMTADERGAVAEEAGQSDFWQVEVHNDIFNVIDTGRSIKYD